MTGSTSLPVVLLAFANDRNDETRYLRNLPDELRNLREALRPAVTEGLCEVVELANATADDIFQVFQSRKYRNRIAIFHFGGHAGGYELLLENTDGHAASANAGGFAKFLAEQSSLELVFLNGCSTRKQTQGLLDAGVGAVITTARAIDDAVATKLSQRFYRALAAGTGLSSAFRESVAAVETESGGSTRALYAVSAETDDVVADQLPWDLFFRPGAESAADWNLPNTVRNPLFGLPVPSKTDLPQSPYRHLQWFQREHAEVFFGRGEEIRDLYQKVTNPDTSPIVLFYGQSGVGKSSLLDAGLLPRLETSQQVIYLRRDAEQGLSGTLDLAFLPEGVDLSPGPAWRAREKALGRPLTVVLDQVEEVFTRPCGAVSDELGMFLDHINEVFHDRETRPEGRLVIGFRKEWLAEITRQLSDARLPYTEVFLERLDRRGVLEVVNGPASNERLSNQYGLQVEPGLAQQIADDLLEDASGSVAPTLQILLSRMWEAAARDNGSQPKFTRDLYTSMRRQGLLLRDFLNRQLDFVEKSWPDIVSPDLLLDLLSLHTTALGTAEERIVAELQQTYSHHADNLSQILDGCRDAYLLTLPGSSADEENATRLAHDTLAPLVRERFEMSDHPGQRARRILENRVIEWQGGAVGAPLDEVDLTIVESGQSGMRSWTPDEERMVAASREERRQRQRKRKILKGLTVTAVIAIAAMAGIAFVYAAHAEQQRQIAVVARKDAESSMQAAEEARAEAEQHETEAERATARSAIVPLRAEEQVLVGYRTVAQTISQSELDALWVLIDRDHPDEWRHIFTEAFSNPRFCERVANRSSELVRATIGFHTDRRRGTLELIRTVLSGEPVFDDFPISPSANVEEPKSESFSLFPKPPQQGGPSSGIVRIDPNEVDWRVICACAAVADELKPIDDELKQIITARLLQEMNIQDPRLLGEIGAMLSRFRDALTSAQAEEAIRHLLNADMEKTAGNFPVKIGTAMNRLVGSLEGETILPVLQSVVKNWCNAQHTEKQMLGDVILQLSEAVPADSAVEAWRYLEKHHNRYAKYMQPIDYFKAMGRLAETVPNPKQLAEELAGILKERTGSHHGSFAFQATLISLRGRVPENVLAQHVTPKESWKGPEVREWVASLWAPNSAAVQTTSNQQQADPHLETAWNLVNLWYGDALNLDNFIDKRNRHAVVEATTGIAADPQTDLNYVKTAINVLSTIAKPAEVDRRRIRTGLLQRISDQFNANEVWNDALAINNIALLGLPSTPDIDKKLHNRIIDGLKSQLGDVMVQAAISQRESMKGRVLAQIVDVTIQQMAKFPLDAASEKFEQDLYTQRTFQQLLSLPGVVIPPDKLDAVCEDVATVYRVTLKPSTGSFLVWNVRNLPNPAAFLPQTTKTEIATLMDELFLAEVGHSDLAALAIARGGFSEPISKDTRIQMLIKLALWMYRLPPPEVNSSPPMVNTAVPRDLSYAMLSLTAQTDDSTRIVCAHSIMHASLQLPFRDVSGKDLQNALYTIASQCEPAALVELLKSPWCVDDSQRIIMEVLEDKMGTDLGGSYWAIYEHREKLGLSDDDLTATVRFPEKLRYDAKVPTYVMAGSSAPQPLGQGLKIVRPTQSTGGSSTAYDPDDSAEPKPPQPQKPQDIDAPRDFSEPKPAPDPFP